MPVEVYTAIRKRRQDRHRRLVELGYSSYGDYLRSDHWHHVRANYRASDRPQACICGATTGLHLHHLTYERVGAETLDDLTPLCPTCHVMVHALEARGEMGLDFAGLVSASRAAGYAKRRNPEAEHDRRNRVAESMGQRYGRLVRRAVRDAIRQGADVEALIDDLDRIVHTLNDEAGAARAASKLPPTSTPSSSATRLSGGGDSG